MEDINEHIQNTSLKIDKLNKFIALSLRRKNISKELEHIVMEASKAQNLLTEVHELMNIEFRSLESDYEEIMSEMRKKQIVVMEHIIKKKQEHIKDFEEEEKQVNVILSCAKSKINVNKAPKSAIKKLGSDLSLLNLNHSLAVTPKIKIKEYKESPLIKRKVNTLLFQFEEFDVTITQQQFDTIPKYMCGRETLDQLNSFLKTVIIPCFNEKYKLIHKDRSTLRNLNDVELWKLYNDQASCLPGRTFITPGDITRQLNKMVDKKTQNRLVMLRHIGIISEVRVKQTVCYVWLNNEK